ncbi:oncomodulin-like [Pyxicephalus adspersus]|uniref:oncomodulin-like n=1 Tax=Pyxicephalus adspersus TaxID=30357 RepID=UPI003B5C98DB
MVMSWQLIWVLLILVLCGPTVQNRFKMSLKDMLSASNIDAALRECKAPDTFNHKEFLQTCGPFENTLSQVQELFQFLDDDRSGYIEEEELKNLLINFDPSARELTSETREFMAAADHDNDGRVGADEFQELFEL